MVEAGEESQAQLAAQFLQSEQPAVAVLLREDAAPGNVPEGYLKLHLLSHRLVEPHGTSLDGLFGILPNVAWTSEGAIDIGELPAGNWRPDCAARCWKSAAWTSFPK